MHRETIISREIKLLKNKFEALEKNRQFRSMLQKSSQAVASGDSANDDLTSGLDGSSELSSRKRSETTTVQACELDSLGRSGELGGALSAGADSSKGAGKSVRIKMSRLGGLGRLFAPLFGSRRRHRVGSRMRRKSNRVSSVAEVAGVEVAEAAPPDQTAGAGGQAEAAPSLAGQVNGAGEPSLSQAPAESKAGGLQFEALLSSPNLVETIEVDALGQQQQQAAGERRRSGFFGRLFGGL